MTDRRQSNGAAEQRHHTPALGTTRATAVSGEYRRPEVRRTTSTTSLEAVRVMDAEPTSGPRHFPTVQMMAVVRDEPAPLSSGRMLDDALGFDLDFDADGALELDCLPSSHRPRVEQPRQPQLDVPPASRTTSTATLARPRGVLPPAPPWPMASAGPQRLSSSTHRAPGTHAAYAAFAGFGDAPAGVFAQPGYALRVILRKRELRGDLARARVRRTQDIALYEGALRTADDSAVRNGFLMMVALLIVAGASLAAMLHLL